MYRKSDVILSKLQNYSVSFSKLLRTTPLVDKLQYNFHDKIVFNFKVYSITVPQTYFFQGSDWFASIANELT